MVEHFLSVLSCPHGAVLSFRRYRYALDVLYPYDLCSLSSRPRLRTCPAFGAPSRSLAASAELYTACIAPTRAAWIARPPQNAVSVLDLAMHLLLPPDTP